MKQNGTNGGTVGTGYFRLTYKIIKHNLDNMENCCYCGGTGGSDKPAIYERCYRRYSENRLDMKCN